MDFVAANQSDSNEDAVLKLEYDIEEDVEAELEEFVRLSHTGQFEDAHKLFDECLSSQDDWYPIAAEYADCLLREGDLEKLAAFSEKAAVKLLEPSERTLLNLMHIISGKSKETMWLQLQSLWPRVSMKSPFTSMTDTDIHVLEILLLILVLTERRPKDLDITLMTKNSSYGSWDVFIDWYNHLLSHQYFWEAQRILQTLLHDTGPDKCQYLVRNFLKTIDSNIDQESAKIAGSALIQSFLYRSEIGRSDPLAVVRWNDAISWALFGMTFAEAKDEPTSIFSCVSLRRSVQETFGLKLPLPSNGVNNTDEMSDRLFDAIQDGDEQAMRQRIPSEKRDWNELRGDALLVAASKNPDKIRSFLDSSTVNARDAFQRTPLHWASLTGQTKAVELLLDQKEVDTGLHDWFGSSPLHYAIRDNASTSTSAP